MRERAMPSRPDAVHCGKARDREGAGQARPALRIAAALALAPLTACVGSPAEGPFEFYRQVTGKALEGRPMPPGLDQPRPNLGTVPQRPDRGPASARAELSTLLAANRAAAASPPPTGGPIPERPATEGLAAIPAAPPAPARLAPAPPIGAGPATLLLPGSGGGGSGNAPANEVPFIPDQAPAAPPPELTAPPPPDLSQTPSFPPIAPRGL